MTRSGRAGGGVVALVAAALAVAGCGSDAKVTETRDGRVTVSGKGNRQTARVEGDGSSVVYATGTVPDGFPSAVPLPTDARLGTTASGTRAGAHYFQLNYTLPGASASSTSGSTAAAALAAYGTQLNDAGFDVTDGAGRSFDASNDTWQVRAVAGAGTTPTLAVTVTEA